MLETPIMVMLILLAIAEFYGGFIAERESDGGGAPPRRFRRLVDRATNSKAVGGYAANGFALSPIRAV